jgi:hypothetical protein
MTTVNNVAFTYSQQDLLNAIKDLREKKLLPIDSACKMFNPEISRYKLKKWTTEGKIIPQRFDKITLYKIDDIIKLSEQINNPNN